MAWLVRHGVVAGRTCLEQVVGSLGVVLHLNIPGLVLHQIMEGVDDRRTGFRALMCHIVQCLMYVVATGACASITDRAHNLSSFHVALVYQDRVKVT